MRRKVDVSDLAQGMYVCELDRPWRETPFLFQGFEITTQGELDLLRQYCRHVFVETEPPEATTYTQGRLWHAGRQPPQIDEAQHSSRPQLRVVETMAPEGRRPPLAARGGTTLEGEVEAIRATHEQATTLIYTIMEDVQLGKSIDTVAAKQVVASMAKSVLRNPDALVCFTHLKKKDDYTALHCLRVSILALVFGRHLGFDEETLNLLGMGALLHDIGKMRVPNAILNKPGKLTEGEFEIMKSHVPLGVEILQRTKNVPAKAIELTRHHHERYSGIGYMERLQQDQISQFGLIAAIVDVYDAITSDRVYQKGISALDALKKMYEWRGKDFHPTLIEQFIQCIGIFPIGSVVVLNTEEVGVVRTMNREQRLKPQVVLVLRPDKRRYRALRAVDLARETTPHGKPYEIAKVLPAGQYGIQPVDYLPVAASA
jgi:putative nucleotidyltransferase with HDIG domain